ncbi:MAG TPA: ABC transporter permease [Pyrinomonadaceae bacterium]|jgi:lipopolysaccharide transport system permease protein|nr:ABC transporter permease [Pyrinomonadaceae bacterium]
MRELTDKPLLVEIKPGRKWLNFDLGELWTYRELIYFLTWREIKIRYKQTAIGVFWAILQPVLTTVIFTAIFSSFARFGSTPIPYEMFALSGLLIWLYVNTAVSNASASLIVNTQLVTKVYIPRLILPLAMILSGLADLLIGLLVLSLVLPFYPVHIGWQALLAPIFVIEAVFLALSVGILSSALNVRFRDVKHALPFFLQVWMFMSPVFYPVEMLPDKWRWMFSFNPLYGLLQGFRASILGGPFHWRAIAMSLFVTFCLLVFSLFIFKKMEEDFADII